MFDSNQIFGGTSFEDIFLQIVFSGNMKILLVGANSSLACALKLELGEFAKVITAGRNNCDVRLDLAGDISVAPGIDAVINTACHFGGKDAASMIAVEQINELDTLSCLDKNQCGPPCAGIEHHRRITQTSPFFNTYALSKRHGDKATQLFSGTYKLPLAIVRPFQFYGVVDLYRRSQPFLYTVIDKVQANDDIVIYGSYDAQRNFIPIVDVAKIFALDQPNISDNAITPDDMLYHRLGYFPRVSIADGMQMEAAHPKLGLKQALIPYLTHISPLLRAGAIFPPQKDGRHSAKWAVVYDSRAKLPVETLIFPP